MALAIIGISEMANDLMGQRDSPLNDFPRWLTEDVLPFESNDAGIALSIQ